MRLQHTLVSPKVFISGCHFFQEIGNVKGDIRHLDFLKQRYCTLWRCKNLYRKLSLMKSIAPGWTVDRLVWDIWHFWTVYKIEMSDLLIISLVILSPAGINVNCRARTETWSGTVVSFHPERYQRRHSQHRALSATSEILSVNSFLRLWRATRTLSEHFSGEGGSWSDIFKYGECCIIAWVLIILRYLFKPGSSWADEWKNIKPNLIL